MGCDGGTIPRRDELVKVKKRPERKDKESELVYKWRHCSLTQERLVSPIVTCGLGKLYNKQAIIEGLLSKSLPESCSHIKSLKDIKDLKLTPNPVYQPSNDVEDNKVSPFICPILRLEMTGRFRFVMLWTCGCVLSERAIKEVKINQCSECQTPFTDNDLVVLNGTEEDVEVLLVRIFIRKQLLKEAKRASKDKKKAESTITSTGIDAVGPSKEIENSTTDSQKVEPKLDKKVEKDGPSTSRSLKREAKDLKPIHDPMFKKAKGEYSVAKDPNATEVFKSLFTSHSDEKEQDRAHWVTYNPFYN